MPSTRWLAPIGIALFAWIVWSAGPDKLLQTMLTVNTTFLAVAMLLIPVGVLLKSLKWRAVLSQLGQKVALAEACRIWLIGLFAATLTPGRLGDFIKALYARERGLTTGNATAAVFIERLTDLVALFSLAALGLLMTVFQFGSGFTVTLSLVAFIAGGFVLLWMITHKKFVATIAKPFYKHIIPERHKEKLRTSFDDMYCSITNLLKLRKTLLKIFLLTYCAWTITFLSGWLITISLGLSVPLQFIVAFTPIAVVIELIPVTIAGFGTREATLIFLFGLLGVSSGSVIAYSLLGVMLSLITAAVGGIFWLRHPVKISLS